MMWEGRTEKMGKICVSIRATSGSGQGDRDTKNDKEQKESQAEGEERVSNTSKNW